MQASTEATDLWLGRPNDNGTAMSGWVSRYWKRSNARGSLTIRELNIAPRPPRGDRGHRSRKQPANADLRAAARGDDYTGNNIKSTASTVLGARALCSYPESQTKRQETRRTEVVSGSAGYHAHRQANAL